jgi:hypothetical protein
MTRSAKHDRPFAAKGMLFNYNIPFLDSVFDKVLFVQIKRDPVTNVASVLEARKRQLGDEAAWYSFKIPEYEQLQGLDPITQAAGQVHYINRAVTRGLEQVDDSRKLVVQYEDFCDDPRRVFDRLIEMLGMPERRHIGAGRFKITRADDFLNRAAIEASTRVFEKS